MIIAIEKMNDYYKDKKIDFIHQAISLPGIAKMVCFKSIIDPTAEFHLFNFKQKDIYQLCKQKIVGGPSIIFNRLHEAGVTNICHNPNKPCKSIVGYDANALYLWAIGQDMPTNLPLVRKEATGFRREFPGVSDVCRDWIKWISHERNIEIRSVFHGGEIKISKYKVDGYHDGRIF